MPPEGNASYPARMLAVRLHGPRDLRVDEVPHPGLPGKGQVLLRIRATSVCGSDLHSYRHGRTGDTGAVQPLVLGHEFSAEVEEAGLESLDGHFQPLLPGMRVAVDPAQPCGECSLCREGNPNLCPSIRFCGNYPVGGSLCDWMLMPAHSCFPVPDEIDDAAAALLEPAGVALHAADLARIRVGTSAAILGAGPIGLLILQIARLAGADPVFVTDRLPWRLDLARKFGGIPIHCEEDDATRWILDHTHGLGTDVAVESAWGAETVAQAAEIARPGGCLVLVGIPEEDRLVMKHSAARRKGLTILMSRRMKHVMPRVLRLVSRGLVDVHNLISHRFPLTQAPDAFELNAEYKDNVTKVVIDH
ncbi:MAG: gutB [Acidobacteria bacterium]|nr:gutB [Acidobacteriota bacterium]